MWPPHRQAVLTNQCVRPGPRPRPGHRPCPRPGWPPGRLEPSGVTLHGELVLYLESLLRLALRSAGEGQAIQVSISSGGCREGPPRDESCVHRGSEGAKKEGYREPGSGPDLRSMWDGFSVDRYAPRGRAGTPPPAPEGCCLHGRSCRTPRARPGTAPAARSRSEQSLRSRPPSPRPGQPRRGGRSKADARRPPRSRVGESGREPPPSDGVAVAKATGRTPPPGRPKSKSQPAEQQQSWAADGDTSLRLRRAACGWEVKPTKLVEQRHELIRNNLMEKQRRELMERSRMVNNGLKRRKLGRHIAVRICLREVEQYRKSQASLRLQNLRSRTREQTAQYHAELRAMKERVASAPYLFEQVTQNNIRGTVERLFARVLRRLQLDEELVLKASAAGGRGHLRLVDREGQSEAGGWDPAASPPSSDDDRGPLRPEPGHQCGYADCAGRQDSAAC